MISNRLKDLFVDRQSAQQTKDEDKHFSPLRWFAGIMFTIMIAAISFILVKIPGIDHIGSLACAILIAVLYRQTFGYPESLRDGIHFSAKRLLRVAIILFGLKLNIQVVFDQGLGLLLRDVGVISFAILLTVWLGKLLKSDATLTLLLAVGTGVCGAAAIAAVSPIIKAKDDDTAIGAGLIALVGTVFSLTYTLIRPFLSLSPLHYGIWSGVSLHEIAHVALAGAPAGPDALAIALLAKLGRVLLLVPLSFLLMFWMKRKNKGDTRETKFDFPWFLIGFILMSLFGSYVLGKSIPISANSVDSISKVTTFILTSAMVGLGLNVNLRELRSKALKPLIAMLITSLLLSFITFFIA